ncbi:MAG: M20/M25/M40 family metallo-hydrolase [Victivallales bacterium]|nr:M20/M25/M40 family metallo-hydrolase [Victivallales bacterium]
MEEYLELLKKLVENKSVTADIAAVNRASAIMADFLRSHGISVTVETCNGRDLLYASRTPGKECDVLLNAHLDVVPPSFEGHHQVTRKGDVLYGRGVNDDLGPAVGIARFLVEYQGKTSCGTIFCCDEENGGVALPPMLERGYRAKKAILVVDSSSIVVAQKGIVNLVLVAKGKSCHAASPWNTGENAINRLIDGYLKLRPHLPVVTKDDQWHTTMTPTMLSGSPTHNQIPEEATMLLNCRFTEPGEEEKLIAMAREISGLDVRVEGNVIPVVVGDENEPALHILRKVMREVLENPNIDFTRMNGATDARYFIKMNVPIASIGWGGGNAHSAEEFQNVKFFDEFPMVCRRFCDELAD